MSGAGEADRLAALRAELAAGKREYRLRGSPAPDRAEFEFIGSYGGEEVVWDTELVALGRAAPEAGITQFIEVGDEGRAATRRLRIGLAIAAVDHAAILKSIIMIRNYRRLQAGRHEWQA